jgi:hypothetical protein
MELTDRAWWHQRLVIEKYSPDQTAWAETWMHQRRAWRRLPVIGDVLVSELHGDWLRHIFPHGPEDGYAYCEGNLLVNGGLTALASLITGASTYGPFSANTVSQTTGHSIVGVGTNTSGAGAPAAVTDTTLRDNGGTCWYQGSDATYPNLSTGTGLLTNQSTFASGVANFAWNEWCWVTITGTAITASATLASTGTSPTMWNHKTSLSSGGGATLGTKGSGATWVFATTLQFS